MHFADMKTNIDWTTHLACWRMSGRSRKACCLENGISYSSFIYHQRRRQPEVCGFDQVMIDNVPSTSMMEYHFPQGGYLVFPVRQLKDSLSLVL